MLDLQKKRRRSVRKRQTLESLPPSSSRGLLDFVSTWEKESAGAPRMNVGMKTDDVEKKKEEEEENMSAKSRDRLVVTEDSDDDNEHEEMSSGDDSGVEGPSSRGVESGDPDETVAFPTIQKKKKKVIKKLTRKEASLKHSVKEYRIKLAMVKPDITTDREKERNLRRIATKGVVQLFNAVSDRQKTMSDAVKEKMTARDRKEARERFDGKNFDSDKFADSGYGYSGKNEVKGEDHEEEEMDLGDDDQIDTGNYSDED
uniref:RRP15-like protein n=2 Tax=Caenorhabditis tropicalis TaxID=1561998 RepID=A0A1I7U1K3_9PELO